MTAPTSLDEAVARAIEAELNRDFEVWFARWGTPAGIMDDAPEPPSRWETSSHKIAQAAIRAVLEGIMEPPFEGLNDVYCSVETEVPDPENGDLYHEDRGWTAQMAHDDIRVRWKTIVSHIIERECGGEAPAKPRSSVRS